MYSYLKGILSEKNPTTIVVDCNGIGYELFIPLSTYDNRNNFWRFTIGLNYLDYGSEVNNLVSIPWAVFDVTVPFWYWAGSYNNGKMPIMNATEGNPASWMTPGYLRKAGRR